MRLEPQAGERIDRGKAVSFTFAGWKTTGFEGDTIASAAFAAGRRVFSRSFKYHRPRGLLCCSGHCPNCQMTVDGVPNVRVCTEPVREGAVVEGQNVRWSLDFDFMSLTDKIGGPFTPAGFYYRTFIRPRAAWPLYEKFLRGAAGLGKLDPRAGHSRRYDTEHRRARVLVVGGGEAGRNSGARGPAKAGGGVVLVDERSRATPDLCVCRRQGARAGTRPGDLGGRACPGPRRGRLTGSGPGRSSSPRGRRQPLVFPGNDLIGVMSPYGVRRLVASAPSGRARGRWSWPPTTTALEAAAGSEETAPRSSRWPTCVSARPRGSPAHGRQGARPPRRLEGEPLACDLIVVSGGAQPAYSLLAQAGAKVEYDAAPGVFVPTELPDGVEAAGTVAGDRPRQDPSAGLSRARASASCASART